MLNKVIRASRILSKSLGRLARAPRSEMNAIEALEYEFRALDFARGLSTPPVVDSPRDERPKERNPLLDHFEANKSGPGIYKWRHYFEIYHRHLSKFVGRDVRIVEIGVYSGGSLGMWRSYFGDKARIVGIDLVPVCKVYENEHTKIVIGDQEDRSFWRKFWAESGPVDVVIDDGGHTPEQQFVSLEECLPRLEPGGVYICEDIYQKVQFFASYLAGLNQSMNEWNRIPKTATTPEEVALELAASPFQSQVHSIHLYPQVAVIEKHDRPTTKFSSERQGTQWQPIPL